MQAFCENFQLLGGLLEGDQPETSGLGWIKSPMMFRNRAGRSSRSSGPASEFDYPTLSEACCAAPFLKLWPEKPVSERPAWARRDFRMEITETRLKAALDSINKGADAGRLTWSNNQRRAVTGQVGSPVADKMICTPEYLISVLLRLRRRTAYWSFSANRTSDRVTFRLVKEGLLRSEGEYQVSKALPKLS